MKLWIKYKIIGSGGIILKYIANVKSKKHHKFLVTAVCIATLGAQFAQITNVKADDSTDPAPQEQTSDDGAGADVETPKTSTDENLDSDKNEPEPVDSDEETDTTTESDKDESSSKEGAPIINDYPDTGVSSYNNVNNTRFSVYTTAKVQVTNENGTDSTPTNANIGAGADIIDNPDNQYEIVFTVENNEGTNGEDTNPSLLLPRYYESDSSTTHIVLDPDKYDEATLLKNAGLPENTVVKYGIGLSSDLSYDMRTLNGSDGWDKYGEGFDLSQVTHIYIDNRIATDNDNIAIPDGLHTLIFPLKILENDPINDSGIAIVGTGDMSNAWGTRKVAFHIVNAPEPEEPEVDPNKDDDKTPDKNDNNTHPTTEVESDDTDDITDNDDEEKDTNPETTPEDNEEEPVVSPNEPIVNEEPSESKDTDSNSTEIKAINNQNDTPIYQINSAQSNRSSIQGYKMNKASDQNTKSLQNTKSELLPQAGNDNNSKIQLMGIAILSMVAGIFGIDLKKKYQNSL